MGHSAYQPTCEDYLTRPFAISDFNERSATASAVVGLRYIGSAVSSHPQYILPHLIKDISELISDRL